MGKVKQDLLAALKIAGEAVVQTAATEIGPIEAAGLTALNTLIADLLAKVPQSTQPAQ